MLLKPRFVWCKKKSAMLVNKHKNSNKSRIFFFEWSSPSQGTIVRIVSKSVKTEITVSTDSPTAERCLRYLTVIPVNEVKRSWEGLSFKRDHNDNVNGRIKCSFVMFGFVIQPARHVLNIVAFKQHLTWKITLFTGCLWCESIFGGVKTVGKCRGTRRKRPNQPKKRCV